MYCLLFVKWQTNWNWGYVDIKVSLSLDFQQFQQVDPVTVTASLLWIYYVNWMTVQYRVVIEVDTEISTISVSYIYLSIKSLDVKCFMHTGTRSAKAIIVDWSALDQDQGRMGARLMCCSISFQAEFFCHDNDIYLLAFLWSKAAAILQQNKDEDRPHGCSAVIQVMEWGLSIHSTVAISRWLIVWVCPMKKINKSPDTFRYIEAT